MDAKLKHLEFVQNVISRMSANSFSLKGWSVLLTSALFALSAPNSNEEFVLLAYVPLVVLWGLDGYFLGQERLFRDLYDRVAEVEPADVDFSLKTEPLLARSWIEATLSTTLVPFYGVLSIAITVVAVAQS